MATGTTGDDSGYTDPTASDSSNQGWDDSDGPGMFPDETESGSDSYGSGSSDEHSSMDDSSDPSSSDDSSDPSSSDYDGDGYTEEEEVAGILMEMGRND
ncbi:hypothetical protein LTR56_012617 [Elasticomyces elasticus]|nr:hypothetical protein LTR22_018492 [Elasticomyces elasticus]KAK3639257.1 hypothetical protein LTR56_012617 [Elasticomyces elasticus]KAK4912561.1 hypothetical protein LTR49_019028 [Elasticomyces elasticus]KAK5751897.1 hypothetical protein LTS12_018003 [Elasticomyces elasticus]